MRSWKRNAAALIINIMITLMVLLIRGFDLRIYYVDAFSVAGSISILLGLLLQITDAGAFDTIGYGFSALSVQKKYRDLYEYSMKKKEKRSRRKGHFLPFIVIGLGFLGISLLAASAG